MSKKNKNLPNTPKPSVTKPVSRPVVSKTKASTPLIAVEYDYLWALVTALFAGALYAITFRHEYVLDDAAAITYNNYVQEGLSGIPKLMKVDFWFFMNLNLGYYRPLSLITFAIEQQFFGDDPHIRHVGNVIFYALTGFFLNLLLQRWFHNRHKWFALLIGLLFIAHPVHTEVVSNIKSRDELLSFLNMTATLLLFTTYLDTRQLKYLGWSCLTFYMAYLSKESSITTLGIIPLIAYFMRGESIKQSLTRLLPYLGVTLLFFMQKMALLGTISGKPPMDQMVYPYFLDKTRFVSMFKQFAYYIKIVLVPHPLIYDYSYNQMPSGSLSDPITWAGIVLFLGLAYLTIKGIQQRSLWGFGLALFFATLLPALAFTISRGGIMAERFLYSPILGFSIIGIWGMFTLVKSSNVTVDSSQEWLKANLIPTSILGALIVVYSIKTVVRANDWKDEITLFKADDTHTQNNSNARKHLGDSIIKLAMAEKDPAKNQKLFDEGVTNLKKSIGIYPMYGEAYFGLGYAYHNALKPNFDSAKYYYKLAIERTPRFVVSYNNLGVIYELSGRKDLASYWYNMAVRVNPNYENSQKNLTRLRAEGVDFPMLPDSILRKY
ncbi:MAG: tetratricopeptide repeat protein [Spirosomataceae bacterium]